MVDNEILDKWRSRFGVISKIEFGGIEYVIRGLQFEELHKWSAYIKEGKNSAGQEYDIDPKIVEDVLSVCILFPEKPDVKTILNKPGFIIELCNLILSITQFENQDFLLNCYIEKHRNANMFYGVVRMRLLSVYGIGILEHLRALTTDEIVELLVYAEYSTDSVGQFTEMIGKPEILPRDKKGKIIRKDFMKLLFGDAYQEQPEVSSESTATTRRKPTTFEDLVAIEDRTAAVKPPDIEHMTAAEYAQAKKEGKIPSATKQFGESIETAKTALARRIQEDKERFGVELKRRPGGFKGNVQDLLDGKI